MPEGDALHRAARNLQVLVGEKLDVETPHPRARLTGVADRLDGHTLLEHVTLFPTGRLVDLHHPARGEPGVVELFSAPAFAQATVRHALFGAVLGALAAD